MARFFEVADELIAEILKDKSIGLLADNTSKGYLHFLKGILTERKR
jgi:hypothetical protein